MDWLRILEPQLINRGLSKGDALEPEDHLNQALIEDVYLLWVPLLWVPSKVTTAPITSPEVVETVCVTSPEQLARRKESKMERVRSMLELLSDWRCGGVICSEDGNTGQRI